MKTYYGRIDLNRMPPAELIRAWGRQAREIYRREKERLGVTWERFEIEYSWHQIADWQEARR